MKKVTITLMALALVLVAMPVMANGPEIGGNDEASIDVSITVQKYAEIDFAAESLSLNLTDRERQYASTTFTVLANFDHDIQMSSQAYPDSWQEGESGWSTPFAVNGAGENNDLTIAYIADVFEGDSTDWNNDWISPDWRYLNGDEGTVGFAGGEPGKTNTFTLQIYAQMDEAYGGTYSGEDTLAIAADDYQGELTFTVVTAD